MVAYTSDIPQNHIGKDYILELLLRSGFLELEIQEGEGDEDYWRLKPFIAAGPCLLPCCRARQLVVLWKLGRSSNTNAASDFPWALRTEG